MTTICIIDYYSNYNWLFKTNGNFLIVNDIINDGTDLLNKHINVPLNITKAVNEGLSQLIDTTSAETLRSYMSSCNLQYISDKNSMIEYCNKLDHIIFLPIGNMAANNIQPFITNFIRSMKAELKNELQIVYLYNTFLLSQYINENNYTVTPLSLVRYIKQQVSTMEFIKEKLYTTSIPYLIIDNILYVDTNKKIETLYKFLARKFTNVFQPNNIRQVDITDFRSIINQLSCTTLATYLH